MAFENNQQEPALPIDNKGKIETVNHLPKYFRTDWNKKFLGSTLDQILQTGTVEKINGYYGRKTAKAYKAGDSYISEDDKVRNDYQLEPASVIRDSLGNVIYYADYLDFINKIKILNGKTDDHSILNSQEFYAWDPHIDWDKFVNFREYYWLPTGPTAINVAGQSKDISSTFTVGLKDNVDNLTYLFTPDGLTDNPNLQLFRGQTYRFEIDVPNYPIAFATKKSFSPGEAILIEKFEGLRSEGVFDVTLYDSDNIAYDAGGFIIPPNQASFNQGEQVNTSLIYDTGVTMLDDEGNEVSTVFLEKGIIEFKVPENAPDYLYYISKTDANVSGFIRIYDIIENTEINVVDEIVGKKTYKTTSGFDLSNGMKVKFVGDVTPSQYANNEFFVEGVGDAIDLINVKDLDLRGVYTENVEVEFGNFDFDSMPYDEALGYPLQKDYIVINRKSKDRNLWSRYNRWFHKSVIEKALIENNLPISIDQSLRAKRPIIEFESGLKLLKFGTKCKKNVDLIDFKTTDVFSTIEGKLGYNIDGVDVTQDMRILFAADTDSMVKNKIYKVNFVNTNNQYQISLIEEDDTNPILDETVFINSGLLNGAKFYYFNGSTWGLCQEKTAVNQSPLFDLFDEEGDSYASSKYEFTQFTGNKLFSYEIGNGTNDNELNFPLLYRSIVNSGDITFSFNLINETYTFMKNNVYEQIKSDIGYLKKYDSYGNFKFVNGWQKALVNSYQNVIRQYIVDTDTAFKIDVYDNMEDISNLWLRVYKNNVLQYRNIDYIITIDVNKIPYVEFIVDVEINDVILLKTRSNLPKNNNGMYEIPPNLEKNPLNENIINFTLGEVSDHVSSIIEEMNNFVGSFPGVSNLRDVGNVSHLGRKFVKHSSPLNFSLFHLIDTDQNIIKAIDYVSAEYNKFIRLFFETAESLGYDGPTRLHLDKILQELKKDKNSTYNFYFSDMVAFGGNAVSEIEVEDLDQKFFALTSVFNPNEYSLRAILVYLNEKLLIYKKDYYFNDEGFVVVTANKKVGDVIQIFDYDSTAGSYIPPTPTKLGIFPKFEPKLYIEKTTSSITDIPETDPFKFYGCTDDAPNDIGWFYPLYKNYQTAIQVDKDNHGTGEIKTIIFSNTIQPFYMPVTDAHIAVQDNDSYTEVEIGVAVIKGHDGSIVKCYKDFRDNLYLELQKRIFNNCKIDYDTTLFDIYDFVPGFFRDNKVKRSDIAKGYQSRFLAWKELVDIEYTNNIYYDSKNNFTYNYGNSLLLNSEKSPGWWKEIFRYVYDTDKPHTHPWEMLGFFIKPDWWEQQYGKGPYTSNNYLMWNDIEQGIVRQPKYHVNNKFVRPGLAKILPVDKQGNLLSPNDCNLVSVFSTEDAKKDFTYGDGSPVEYSWKTSCLYPFAFLRAALVVKSSKVFATAFDRLRQKRNKLGQLIYSETNSFINLKDIELPNEVDNVFTSGLVNYLVEYYKKQSFFDADLYKNRLSSLDTFITGRIAGYTSKDKFKFILDSRTPLNQGNVFIPSENYSIILNKSYPTEEVVYSGVIIQKEPEGFYIKGYDKFTPTFNYIPVFKRDADPLINVGGVSESFLLWEANQLYIKGIIVRYEGSYYRCIVEHTTGNNFDSSKFIFLAKLPIIGGVNALLRTRFQNTVQTLAYGTLLRTLQDVVDFLLGYGEWLEKEGFSFTRFDQETYQLVDWTFSAKQFMFWITQNWSAGAVITLSPGAEKISFTSNKNQVSDNIFDSYYDYGVLKADGTIIKQENLAIFKNAENTLTCTVINENAGIYLLKVPLISVEHIAIIDNTTVFNDVIFSKATGYRQERLKVIGYKVADWNGSLNPAGFIYYDAFIDQWQEYKDYAISDVVKYKEFYYIADKKIVGSANFDNQKWVKLNEKPPTGLFPNLSYKINQFADFYDLDSDNLDANQQKLGQHLIGYQKRNYLSNIINDDVSQYKFYQGFIREKGTKNVLSKLFDVLSASDKDSLDFYDEWAVRTGYYGAVDSYNNTQFLLDSKQIRLNPQPILLTNNTTGNELDLIYRIQSYQVYQKPKNYNHKPFPLLSKNSSYVNTIGNVLESDVNFVVDSYTELRSLREKLIKNDTIWITNYNNSWDVVRYVKSEYRITKIFKDAASPTSILIEISDQNNDIKVGEYLDFPLVQQYRDYPDDSTRISSYTKTFLDDMCLVKSKVNGTIEIEVEAIALPNILSENAGPVIGIINRFMSVRFKTLTDLNVFAQKFTSIGQKYWIDNVNNNWKVYENTANYKATSIQTSTFSFDYEFGYAVAVDKNNSWMIVGSPNEQNGKVYVFNRAVEGLEWNFIEIKSPDVAFSSPNERYGSSLALSDDAEWLFVGAPNASFVKSAYKGAYDQETTYQAGDIITFGSTVWKATKLIEGSIDNIPFTNAGNYNQILYELNLDEETSPDLPIILTGTYPFTNITTNHILVRLPYNMYQGINVGDEILFHWSNITYANQDQLNLYEREPFDGTISAISKSFLEQRHMVQSKVDVILQCPFILNEPILGDTITSYQAQGILEKKYQVGSAWTFYLRNVEGQFSTANSLYINATNYIGEYSLSQPLQLITGIDTKLGGFVLISMQDYDVADVNYDTGRGLAVQDVINDGALTNRGFYNILEYNTPVTESENTDNSLIEKLSFSGSPGPFGNYNDFLTDLFVVRAPKSLTDNILGGDEIQLYVNNLKRLTTVLKVRKVRFSSVPIVVKGETLTQENTGFSVIVYDSVIIQDPSSVPTNPTYLIQVHFVKNLQNDFNTSDKLIGSISRDIDCRPIEFPVVDELRTPAEIGLTYEITNKSHTVYDVWDGYVDYRLTEFSTGNVPYPYEPIARIRYNSAENRVVDTGQQGQVVRDRTTGAYAEVIYYKRDGLQCRVYVKDMPGSVDWSLGEDFSDAAEIEMLPFNDPDNPGNQYPDFYNRPNIYAQNRTLGIVTKVSMGYVAGDIGKLLVLSSYTQVPIVKDDNNNQFYQMKDLEYWLFDEDILLGIPRNANIPNSQNLDWQQTFRIPADYYGTPSTYENEGLVYIYRRFGETFSFYDTVLPTYRESNQYFGSDIKLTLQNNLYRAFVSTNKNYSIKDYFGPTQLIPVAGNQYNYVKIRITYNLESGYVTNIQVLINDMSTTILNLNGLSNIRNQFDMVILIDNVSFTAAKNSYFAHIERQLNVDGYWKDDVGYYINENKLTIENADGPVFGYEERYYDLGKSSIDKIYFFKYGEENDNFYSWDFSTDKNFRGEFNNQTRYATGEIVFLPQDLGNLYRAVTNVSPGEFDSKVWELLDNKIDFIGVVPNTTNLIMYDDSNDSGVIRQTNLYKFALDYDTDSYGQVLAVSNRYKGSVNQIAIYRNYNGLFKYDQLISAPNTFINFGDTISVSADGMLLAVGASNDDTIKVDQGSVYIYQQQNGVFVLTQILASPQNEYAEFFGSNVEFDGDKLAVTSRNANNFGTTIIDNNETTFDNNFTTFKYAVKNAGIVYVYEKINNVLVYADKLEYDSKWSNVSFFGKNITLKNNHIYVGLPNVKHTLESKGTVVDFRTPTVLYNDITTYKAPADLGKVKAIKLINKRTNKLVFNLDYIDPLQGKIAGIAEENLTYKLHYDPAIYSTGNSTVNIDVIQSWNKNHVGKLWWDLSTTQFYYPYQGGLTSSINLWSKIYKENTIDVYEWIESDYLPEDWDALADTNEGISVGISGKSKYGNSVYTQYKKYDALSQTFQIKYYFWVKGNVILNDYPSRTKTSYEVARLIENPISSGYKFAGLFHDDSFCLYNCNQDIINEDIIVSFEWWNVENQTTNTHYQYQLITENLSTSVPNTKVEEKWFDSLVGYDYNGRLVPDPTLGENEKYGNLNNPRQGWFKNRLEALKQVITRVNLITKKHPIVDTKNLQLIKEAEEYPSIITKTYDIAFDTLAELNQFGVARLETATVKLVINNGQIYQVIVVNPGRGYLVTPTYMVNGKGNGLEVEFTINTQGSISSATVINAGTGYASSTTLTIRPFTALVKNDESILGKWSLYERNTVTDTWSRNRSQAYNTMIYWNYIDWYAEGYDKTIDINYYIDYTYEISKIDSAIGDIVKIKNYGSGGWALFEKINYDILQDKINNYKIIGKQNTTIEFSNTLYDYSAGESSFDNNTYDIRFYDPLPTVETRNILNAIKNNIFVDELIGEYNKLFVSSLRYVLSEQTFVDWVFKTNFVKIVHNAGDLREDVTFNNDNLPSYEEYVKEVKPFKVKIREYVSSYEKLDINNSVSTDFDLPPVFYEEENIIKPYSVKVVNGQITGQSPNNTWRNNLGFSISSIEIVDPGEGYETIPILRFSSKTGFGLEAVATLGNNNGISSVKIINPGTDYITSPIITVDGGSPVREAKLVAILSDSLPRSVTTSIKFDRVNKDFFDSNINQQENYQGSGSKYVFDLAWPMDLVKSTINILVDNIELLRSEYTYLNVKDNIKGYTRSHGRIIFSQPPSKFSSIQINYKKNIDLFKAQDRINYYYNPTTGMFGKDLGQLMDGIDYGGVEVKSFDFGSSMGWDTDNWFTGEYDTYDLTYSDITYTADGSTTYIDLKNPLEENIVYNLYKEFLNNNGTKTSIRLDDPAWTPTAENLDNPNAIMASIVGDGITNRIELQELGIYTEINDVIILRKSTSDGSFLPTNIKYDTVLEGGNLNYSNAKGLNAEDITVDGDGFATQFNSKGPEELVPGNVQDALDITVYERPSDGSSIITCYNYVGDGINKNFRFNVDVILDENVFVKVNNKILKVIEDYRIDDKEIKLLVSPDLGDSINIVILGFSGSNIREFGAYVADGSTTRIITDVVFETGYDVFTSVNGKQISSDIYNANGFVEIVLADFVENNSIVNYAIIAGIGRNYSVTHLDEFVFDGSTTSFELQQTPFSQTPLEWFTIVKVNNKVLNAGYTETFKLTTSKEYRMRLYQIPVGTLVAQDIQVYLNSRLLRYEQDYNFSSLVEFDPNLPEDQQKGSSILLSDNVGNVDDILTVYVLAVENNSGDSTEIPAGGEYRYGYYSPAGFVATPNILHINAPMTMGDIITVYQFSNHDSQGISRQSFDIEERTKLYPGISLYSHTEILNVRVSEINLPFELQLGKKYNVYLNNVLITDPNYIENPDLVMNPYTQGQTIIGNGTTVLNILNDINLVYEVGDTIKIEQVNSPIQVDPTTKDWYELRLLRVGYVPLNFPALDDQYVWVVKNGVLLSANIDYYVTPDRMYVKIINGLEELDTVETIHFANNNLKNNLVWKQFKDILNRNHYSKINYKNTVKLQKDLNWYDKVIEVTNPSVLPDPTSTTKNPGVIFIAGERIEYFVKDGNYLKQLRRGTFGTGVKNIHEAGSDIFDQSIQYNLPYKDETITTIFTADGTTKNYILDFIPNNVNEFEVFVAGRRLRKNEISSYQLNTELRNLYATDTQVISQDSPEGDVLLPAEFNLVNGNELILLDIPLENQKITIIRRKGMQWHKVGERFSETNSNILRFLQS